MVWLWAALAIYLGIGTGVLAWVLITERGELRFFSWWRTALLPLVWLPVLAGWIE